MSAAYWASLYQQATQVRIQVSAANQTGFRGIFRAEVLEIEGFLYQKNLRIS